MSRALEELAGVRGALGGISVSGRTDPWNLAQVAASSGLTFDDDFRVRFRERYLSLLAAEVGRPPSTIAGRPARHGVMPGVRPLLDAIAVRTDSIPALLTGNFEGGARLKLEHFNLWHYFRCGAYGDDAPDRNGLLATALQRIEARAGHALTPRDAVIVGDTPHDVEVALTGGARSVAVATGSYSVEALRAAGADVVLEDMSDLGATLVALGLDI